MEEPRRVCVCTKCDHECEGVLSECCEIQDTCPYCGAEMAGKGAYPHLKELLTDTQTAIREFVDRPRE